MIHYYARYDYGSYEVDGEYDFGGDNLGHWEICCNSKKALEYIALKCIVNNGNAFFLTEDIEYNKFNYPLGFFTKKSSIAKIEVEIRRMLEFLPFGIELRKIEMKNDNATITYFVSDEYSKKIYDMRNRLLVHTGLFNRFAELIREDFIGEYEHNIYKFSMNEVEMPPLGTVYTWNKLGMMSLPNEFYCFLLADAVADYVYEQKHNDVEFYKIQVYWNREAKYNNRYMAEVVFSYKKKHDKNLNSLKGWN